MERVFFNNSGAEANETALKLARLYGWRKGIEQPLVVVMANAFPWPHARHFVRQRWSGGASGFQ
jgi:acetylornithine/succinyldiaminopimelate/putrescine aminotransferase